MAEIAIVGGGIGGLLTAAVLARNGIPAQVYERRSALPTGGTALGMWPDAMAAAAAAGVDAALTAVSVPQRTGEIRTWRDRRLATLRPRGTVRIVTRPALLAVLHDALPGTGVHWGAAVSGPELLADHRVVVGADGSSSAVRHRWWGPAAAPRPVGQRVWRGTLRGSCPAPCEWWGPGALFGLTPRQDGDTNFFAAVRHTVSGTTADTAVLSRIYAGWPERVRTVIEAIRADPVEVLVHDLASSPVLSRIATDRVALIGDAAHTMLPNLGRGACEAMIDAAVLAESLVRYGSTPSALADYQARRRRRTATLVLASAAVNRIALARRASALRDPMLSAIGRLAA